MLSEDTNDVVLLPTERPTDTPYDKKGRIQYTTGETTGAGLELDLLETVLPECEVGWAAIVSTTQNTYARGLDSRVVPSSR